MSNFCHGDYSWNIFWKGCLRWVVLFMHQNISGWILAEQFIIVPSPWRCSDPAVLGQADNSSSRHFHWYARIISCWGCTSRPAAPSALVDFGSLFLLQNRTTKILNNPHQFVHSEPANSNVNVFGCFIENLLITTALRWQRVSISLQASLRLVPVDMLKFDSLWKSCSFFLFFTCCVLAVLNCLPASCNEVED